MTIGFIGSQIGLSPEQIFKLGELVQKLKPEVINSLGTTGSCHDFSCVVSTIKNYNPEVVLHDGFNSNQHHYFKNVRKLNPTSEANRYHNLITNSEIVICCPEKLKARDSNQVFVCAERAKKLGKTVIIIGPDGKTVD